MHIASINPAHPSVRHMMGWQTVARSISVPFPKGGDDDKFATFSPEALASFAYMDGDEAKAVGPAPLGTHYIFAQLRRCGDWYVELNGKRHVCATAATREDACRAAIQKLAA